MRTYNYRLKIKEGIEELKAIERSQQAGKYRDRVRFIRYLKEGTALTQVQAGLLIGLKRNQSQKLWKLYIEEGIEAMSRNNYKGSWSKLDSHQQARLLQRLDNDDIKTQKQIINWLKDEMNINYTQGGLSTLLSAIKVKLKTRRPVNIRKDEAGEQSFKKTSKP